MARQKVGAVFCAGTQLFDDGVVREWRDAFPVDRQPTKVVQMTVVRHTPETRSYECKVEGVDKVVTLFSKRLGTLGTQPLVLVDPVQGKTMRLVLLMTIFYPQQDQMPSAPAMTTVRRALVSASVAAAD
jgi:hypothetical protein